MTPSKLLSEFAIRIYDKPFSKLRSDEMLRDLSDPIAIVMLISDFETEVSMNGINNFIGNSTGLFAIETVAALEAIGCITHAAKLQRILNIAVDAGMTHETIQQERSELAQHTITSFSELHESKWDEASEKIDSIDSEIDYSEILVHAERFVGIHADAFRIVLGYP